MRALFKSAIVAAAAFISADGGDLPLEVELGGVTRAVQAQNICGVLMRENREGLTVTLPCNLRAFALEVFDVVDVEQRALRALKQ